MFGLVTKKAMDAAILEATTVVVDVDKEKPGEDTLTKLELMQRLGIDSITEFDKAYSAGAIPKRNREWTPCYGPGLMETEWRLCDIERWERHIIDATNKPLIKKHIAAKVKAYEKACQKPSDAA